MAVVLAAVLDDERPAVGIVDHLVAKRGNFVVLSSQRRPVVESG